MGIRVSQIGAASSVVTHGGTGEVTRIDRRARNGAGQDDPPIEVAADEETADTNPAPPPTAEDEQPPSAAPEMEEAQPAADENPVG